MNTDQALELHVTKDFSVSKDQLYRAWTEPEQLKKWWKPLGRHLTNVTNDIREGGEVSYTFDSDELKISGQYKEAKPADRLVYTWNWEVDETSVDNGEYQLTIVFKGDDQQSTLDVRQENFQDEQSIQPHQKGWEGALEDLKNYLENNK